ncbi:MAG: acetate--CoA ligase family protein [Bacillota bacterium]
MTGPDLERFFNPRSVAVVGASTDEKSISGRPIFNLKLHEFKGPIYPVNPKYTEVQGYRAYPTIKELPGPVDVAMLAVNSSRVLASLEECAAAGVKFAIVFSAGFAETGLEDGAALQARMRELARESGMRIVGPNCIGSLNVTGKVPLGFAVPFSDKEFPEGPISFVSQSGAYGYGFMTLASEHGLGFRYIANPGNQVDLDSVDFLQFFADDPETRIVTGYIEGIQDGRRFAEAARTCARAGKPMVILKSGRSQLGQRAAASHTASLAGSETAFDAIAQKYGVIIVHDVEEMLDTLKVLLQGKYPRTGLGVGVVTTSGASGIMAADAAHTEGVAMAELSEETRRRLGQFIPAFGSISNPVDLTAMVLNDSTLYIRAFDIMREAPEVGALAVMLSSPTGALKDRTFADIRATAEQSEKPMVVVATSGEAYTAEFRSLVHRHGLPVFTSPWRAFRALRHLADYAAARERLAAEAIPTLPDLSPQRIAVAGSLTANGGLSEVQVKDLLGLWAIEAPRSGLARTPGEALGIAERLGYPVVVKAVSPALLHKSEAGAVKVSIGSADELIRAYHEVSEGAVQFLGGRPIDGVLVEKMARGGVETFAAVKVDPIYGPLIGFGLGGIYVELFKDVAWWPAPLTESEAHRLIRSVKGYKLLTGYRGRPVADIPALARTLVHLSWLGLELNDRIAELEINPLAVLPEGQGVMALDGVLVRR